MALLESMNLLDDFEPLPDILFLIKSDKISLCGYVYEKGIDFTGLLCFEDREDADKHIENKLKHINPTDLRITSMTFESARHEAKQFFLIDSLIINVKGNPPIVHFVK